MNATRAAARAARARRAREMRATRAAGVGRARSGAAVGTRAARGGVARAAPRVVLSRCASLGPRNDDTRARRATPARRNRRNERYKERASRPTPSGRDVPTTARNSPPSLRRRRTRHCLLVCMVESVPRRGERRNRERTHALTPEPRRTAKEHTHSLPEPRRAAKDHTHSLPERKTRGLTPRTTPSPRPAYGPSSAGRPRSCAAARRAAAP